MTVWTDIAHHNENVKSLKTTKKITSVTKNVPAITFSWLNKKQQNKRTKNIVE